MFGLLPRFLLTTGVFAEVAELIVVVPVDAEVVIVAVFVIVVVFVTGDVSGATCWIRGTWGQRRKDGG